MNKISHEQAYEYIHQGQAYLNPSERDTLAAHLSGCSNCREYARLQANLAPAISQALHARWDRELSRPFDTDKIYAGNRRNTMVRHALISTPMALILAALILGLAAVLTWTRPPSAQPVINPAPAATNTPAPTITKTPASLPVRLDPVVCASQAYPAPAGVYLPYPLTKVIGGGTVQTGDFTFQLYLVCDPSLSPEDPAHFSAIAGLGIFGKWSYDGSNQDANVQTSQGVVPDVRTVTGFKGLSKRSSEKGSVGLVLPDDAGDQWQVPQLAKIGYPIQFKLNVQVNQDQFGAILEFKLQEGSDGYLPVDIRLRAQPPQVPETCPVTRPSDPPFTPLLPYPANPPGNEFWYGTDSLWTALPLNGVWEALPHNPEGYTQKVFWWRVGYSPSAEPQPNLIVTGRRLDAPSPPLHVSRATNAFASDIGSAMLVGVDFPDLGCWEITGRYGQDELSFIIWVGP